MHRLFTTLFIFITVTCAIACGDQNNRLYTEKNTDSPEMQSDMSVDFGDMTPDLATDMVPDSTDMTLEDLSPDLEDMSSSDMEDMSMDELGWVGMAAMPDLVPNTEGFLCGTSQTCEPGQYCQIGGFIPVCVDTPTRPHVAQCDDPGDCLSGVCCNTRGLLTCESSCPANERICESDQACDGGYCCPRRLSNGPFAARNQCQPTPCETCRFEPNTTCWQVTLGEVSLVGKNATEGRFIDVDFTDADLSKTVLKEAVFSGTFSNTVFDEANFTQARFFSVDGKKTTMIGASFIDAMMDGVDMSYINASKSNFKQTMWGTRANWAHGSADDASFEESTWDQSNIMEVSMKRSIWKNAKLENAQIKVTNFDDADFSGARLGGRFYACSFIGVSFKNADLTGALFPQTTFGNNNWDDAICPDGTKAKDHGQTCEGHLEP